MFHFWWKVKRRLIASIWDHLGTSGMLRSEATSWDRRFSGDGILPLTLFGRSQGKLKVLQWPWHFSSFLQDAWTDLSLQHGYGKVRVSSFRICKGPWGQGCHLKMPCGFVRGKLFLRVPLPSGPQRLNHTRYFDSIWGILKLKVCLWSWLRRTPSNSYPTYLPGGSCWR